jgi:phenylalanyl-tRNA synthetase beta chain
MKISYNWLKSLSNIDIDCAEASKLLTDCGLEVESVETYESVKGGLKGLVVGRVLTCEKHPDADKLSLTTVDIGNDTSLSIVCGAPNVAANQTVVVATVGTKLFPTNGEPFEIKKSKIRGAVSEGMLCAEDEIGLGSSHAGIMVLSDKYKVGTKISEVFEIENDSVLEIGLTPNRGDAASHLGVARDLVAVLNCNTKANSFHVNEIGTERLPVESGINQISINVQNNLACKRYAGVVITGIKVGQSPRWLQNRLKSIGLKPINNIVDVTNFVLHELGQPLHAFDLDKISGKQIIVRNAHEGESFVTLDNVTRTLSSDDLVICNEHEPMCLAGIFGGLSSGVSSLTSAIFLESAFFDASTIRKSSKKHSLKTDASFRFERGTDPEMVVNALIRAANLIISMTGGVLSMDVKDIYPEPLVPFKVAFSYKNCNDLIGYEIDKNIIKNIITSIGIKIEKEGSDGMLLNVPCYKSDVTREADVIEEVMRIFGYNNIEISKQIKYTAFNEPKNTDVILESKIGELLEGFGFSEMMNLSLSKETYYSETAQLVKIVNPLSNDLNVLRNNLLYSGLDTIAYNINRKNTDLRLFEFGRKYTFTNTDEKPYTEEKQLTLFCTGGLQKENSFQLNLSADFYYLKSVLTKLLEKCGVSFNVSELSNNSDFVNGLDFIANNKSIAVLTQLSNKKLKEFDIQQTVFYACINWSALTKIQNKQRIVFTEPSKFPTVRRDLALLIDKAITYSEIEKIAFSTEKKFLKEMNLFDIYEGEKLGNKKSYAVSFTLLNSESTLTDKQIDVVMQRLISTYKEKLGAEIR